MKGLVLITALVALCVFAGSASAQCGGGRNIGRIGNLQQRVVGNQLLTFDRFGNVVRRQFINNGGLNVNIGGFRSLQDRLLFGF